MAHRSRCRKIGGRSCAPGTTNVLVQAGLSEELALPSLPTQARIQLLAEPGINNNLFNSLRAELSGTAGELKARTALTNSGAPPPPTASMQTLVQGERFATSGPRPSAVQHNVPAWLVFGMFFVIASLSSLLVQERGTGTERSGCKAWVSRAASCSRRRPLPYLGVNAVQAR